MHKACVVVFDLDDTLYLERDYVRSGFEHVGSCVESEYGIAGFANRAWELFLAGRRNTIFNDLFREFNVPCDQQTIEHLVSAYRSHSPQICLENDSLLCLKALHGNVRLSVITDGPVNSQRNKAVALSLHSWFSPVLLTEELGADYRKPSPSAFQLVQQQSGSEQAQFYYVGDNPRKDFYAPRRLGWKTVRIRRHGGLHSAIEAEGDWAAEFEISDLTELPRLLQQS